MKNTTRIEIRSAINNAEMFITYDGQMTLRCTGVGVKPNKHWSLQDALHYAFEIMRYNPEVKYQLVKI